MPATKETIAKFVRAVGERRGLGWILPTLRYIRGVIRHHSIRRFRNTFEWCCLISLTKWRPLSLDSSITSGMFYLCTRTVEGEKWVLKIPRFDGAYSELLLKIIRNKDVWQRYQAQMLSLQTLDQLGRHFPEVSRVRPDGGYLSKFVEGHNLALLSIALRSGKSLSDDIEPNELMSALTTLLMRIERWLNNGHELFGDWALHNLVYSTSELRIFNVDLEGMCLYDSSFGESNPEFIKSELRSVRQLLQLRIDNNLDARSTLSVLTMLDYAASENGATYSGYRYVAGYHSFKLRGRKFRGQRECEERIKQVPFDFKGKNVLDIGCNAGGMLHHLANEIGYGIGLDFNLKLVNAANLICDLNNVNNLRFYAFNIDSENLGLIENFLMGRKIDICFLLSLLMWVKRPAEIMSFVGSVAQQLLLETNGTASQQRYQVKLASLHYETVELLDLESKDDPGMRARMLYLCSNPI